MSSNSEISGNFPLLQFNASRRSAALIDTYTQRVLLRLPPQDARHQGLPRYPGCPFSAELAEYLGWLHHHHLLLWRDDLNVHCSIEGDCVDEHEDNDHAVHLENLVFRLVSPPQTLWLDAGRAGFVLLDGALYSSFYLDVEQTTTPHGLQSVTNQALKGSVRWH
ncbi:hypothetical protein [Haliea sp.]